MRPSALLILFILIAVFPIQVSAAEPKKSKQAGAQPVAEPVWSKAAERIAAGDHIRIKIYPEDEYIKGGEMEVSSEGTITLPLLGKVKIMGLKIPTAETKIAKLLAKDYLVSPVVVIEVAERVVEKEKRSVAILGQVQKPGSYELPPSQKMTLLQLISTAGGFSDVANVKKIKIIRKTGGKTEVIHANAESIISGNDPDIELEPEDVIHVAESFF